MSDGILERIDEKLNVLLERTKWMEPLPPPDEERDEEPAPSHEPDPVPGVPSAPSVDWASTPGLIIVYARQIGASLDWGKQFDSGRLALSLLVKRWRLRLLGYHGTPANRRNWAYIVRDGEAEPVDALLKLDVSAQNRWDAESTIGGLVQCKPMLGAGQHYGQWVFIDANYRAGELEVLVNGQKLTGRTAISIEIKRHVRIINGSGPSEPLPHTTNAGSVLDGVLFEVGEA